MNDADGKIIIATEIDTKSFDAQINYLDEKARKLEEKLNEPKKYNIDTAETEADLEKIKNQIVDLEKKSVSEGLKSVKNIEFNPKSIANISNFKVQRDGGLANEFKELNGELSYTAKNMKDLKIEEEKVEAQHNKTKKAIDKGFEKGIKSLKNFGIRLLGISSIYGVVSKASSAWLSQDTELANKLQSVWLGLGAIISPVIEGFSNVLLKGLGYLNAFLKALTGVDYIAKANAKAIENQTKSQKKLNKATQDYDFDVIRKQQDTSSSTNSTNTIDTSGLIKIPELDDRIVKKLQDMAYWLKENWHWIKEVGIILGVTFGAIAIGKLLANIGSLIGSGASGLLGLQGLLVGLATAWVISLYVKGYKQIKEQLDDLKETQQGLIENKKQVTQGYKDVTEMYKEAVEQGTLTETQRKGITKTTLEMADALVRESKAIANDTGLWQMFTEVGPNAQEEMRQHIKLVIEMAERMEELYKNGHITKEQYDNFINNILPGVRKQAIRAGVSTKELDDTIKNIPKSKDITIELNAHDNATKTVDTVINKIKQGLGGLFTSTWKNIFGGGNGGKRFAVGGIVTQPTRALIGEAGYPEAVVPMTKDYLSTLASEIGRYSSNSGGGVVNVYLDGRLIQRQVKNTQNDRNFATNN